MIPELKKAAELINTDWCYYLDMDGDIYIHFFKAKEWFEETKKMKPSPDDIMKYRIIFPVDSQISPPNSDWDDVFIQGCMWSEDSAEEKRIRDILDNWGFIDISKVKELTEEDRQILES